MPQSQARIPSIHALIKLILRILSLLLGIIALIFLIYISARYSRSFPVAYAAVLYAFILDTAEIITLTDQQRTVPQLPPLLLMVLEMGALGLLAGGCVTLAFADLAEPGRDQAGYKFQLDPWRLDALWLQVALGILHLGYAVWTCVDGCIRAP